MATWITICDTCKRPGWEETGSQTTDGEVLAGLIEAAAKDIADVRTRRVSCLMGCKAGCNVAIQAQPRSTRASARAPPYGGHALATGAGAGLVGDVAA